MLAEKVNGQVMMDKLSDKKERLENDSALKWDRNLLIGFIIVLSALLIVLNREADGFFPDARLYPYVMTIIGLVLAAISIVRVVLGKEPNMDAQNGKERDLSAEQTRRAYKMTIGYMLVFTAFYLGIWLFGFRIAAAVFVFGFIRYFGHTYLRSSIYSFFGVLLVEVLSRILHLVLPLGLIIECIFQ